MRFMLAAVAAALAASSVGCQSLQSRGCGDNCDACAAPCHITRSQVAPRPMMGRTACGPPFATQCSCQDGGCGECCGDCCGQCCGEGCGECCGSCGGCGNGACGYGANGCGCQSGGNMFGAMAGAVMGGPCGGPSCCPCGPGDSVYDFQPGPPVGQTAYPYYTTRGPRDFLMANPPSIGPTGAYGCR